MPGRPTVCTAFTCHSGPAHGQDNPKEHMFLPCILHPCFALAVPECSSQVRSNGLLSGRSVHMQAMLIQAVSTSQPLMNIRVRCTGNHINWTTSRQGRCRSLRQLQEQLQQRQGRQEQQQQQQVLPRYSLVRWPRGIARVLPLWLLT